MTRVRIAVVGAGWWATSVHLPSLARNRTVDLVALCDPDRTRVAAAAERFGVPHQFSDAREMLAVCAIDAVVVATPHDTHATIVDTCLRHAVHVLVEKPMTTDAATAWQLAALAREVGRVLAVGLTYQYSDAASLVRDAVQNRIGQVVCINAEFSSSTLGLFQGNPPPLGADVPIPGVSTYSSPDRGGGQAHTQLTHLLTGVLWAAGSQASEVSAFMTSQGTQVDVVDALAFRLEGGALGVASSTGTTPVGAPVRHQIRFHGTSGVVEWDMLGAEAWVYRAGGVIEHAANPPTRAPYAVEEVSAAFVEMVRGTIANCAPPDVAAAGVSLIAAAHQAAATRRVIDVLQGPLQQQTEEALLGEIRE